MTAAYRRALKLCRVAHLYLTLFGLVLILFFAATGFMLNHERWFLPDDPRTRTVEADLPPPGPDPVDKLVVCEAVRQHLGAGGLVKSFRTDDETVEVEFARPGERWLVAVRRDTGRATGTVDVWGAAAVLTDLHKGKSAGPVWGLVIDVVCVLLGVIAGTGLVLWSSLKARGKWGAVVVLAGGLVTVAAYRWGVP